MKNHCQPGIEEDEVSENQAADKDQGVSQAADEDLAPREDQAADLQGGLTREASRTTVRRDSTTTARR